MTPPCTMGRLCDIVHWKSEDSQYDWVGAHSTSSVRRSVAVTNPADVAIFQLIVVLQSILHLPLVISFDAVVCLDFISRM